MKSDQMWQAYKILNQTIGDKIDAWAFGVEADYLAELVLMGQKTATSSAFDLYAVGNEPLPKESCGSAPANRFPPTRRSCAPGAWNSTNPCSLANRAPCAVRY